MVSIFISHSSKDAAFAERLVELLRAAFSLAPDRIRCTSIDGHRLPGGAEIDHQLRQELLEAPVFIGVLSKSSFESTYVLFELGARWGARKNLIPLLAPETDADLIQGPISSLNFVRGGDETHVHDMLHQIGHTLGVQLPSVSSYYRQTKEMISYKAGYKHEDRKKSLDEDLNREDKLFREMSNSTVFFSDRFSSTFPGLQGLRTWNGPEGVRRLALLLKQPLSAGRVNPFWWWANGNLPITEFDVLPDNIVLIGNYEYKIRQVTAMDGSGVYWRKCVYVEAEAMKPTGLYEINREHLSEATRTGKPVREEYGLWGRHLITRGEYDDGAAEINDEVVETLNQAVSRVRFITPSNFIIAAQFHPINNRGFDGLLAQLLQEILCGQKPLEMLVNELGSLPRYDERR
jgi:hypothetical protein